MSFLTGKKFETLDDGKTGVAVSDIFGFHDIEEIKSFVAVLWDDGTMSGAVDVETLRIIPEDPMGTVMRILDESDFDVYHWERSEKF